MKLRVQRKEGKLVRVTLVSEDQGDKEVLEALWYQEVSKGRMIYQRGYVVLQAKVSPFKR